MCVSPITIKNPLHFEEPYRSHMMRRVPYKNYTDTYIQVPCGHCAECIRKKQEALVQRINLESRKNHLFMATLTYQPKYLPTFEINGFKIHYANVRHVQNMMKMLKKENAFGIPFRFLAVSELGSERGRPHFHILFLFNKKYFPREKEDYIMACEAFAGRSQHFFTCLKYWRINLGTRRNPKWESLTDFHERFINGRLNSNYDFHYINPFLTKNGIEDAGFYVLKYMFKPSDKATKLQQALRLNLSEEDYERVWAVVRPRNFKSLGFGLNAEVQNKQRHFIADDDIVNKLKDDVKFSHDNLEYPAFVHPVTGKVTGMCGYLQDHILTFDDRMDFWFFKKNGKSVDNSDPRPYSESLTITDYERAEIKLKKTQDHCDALGFDGNLDLLD